MTIHRADAPTRRRVMIFIDGSNLYHVLKQNIDKHDLDYRKFTSKLCGDRELIRTYYYNIRQESSENPRLAENQDRFLNALYETEYLEVKLGIWKPRGHTMVEKGVDVMIAADLISHAYEDHYDVAILVSGDADFYPALQAVKDVGKQVEVAAFDSNLSSESARFADVVTRFSKSYFNDLWMSGGKKNELTQAAARRQLVTDEAASPNGEDKGGAGFKNAHRSNGNNRGNNRNGVGSTRPFTRRRVSILSSPKPATPTSDNARTRVSPRSFTYRSGGRITPPQVRRAGPGSGGESESANSSRNDAKNVTRASWISRMLRAKN